MPETNIINGILIFIKPNGIRMENTHNSFYNKTLEFSHKIMILCDQLKKSGLDYSVIKQMLRSATSIGANFAESRGAVSDANYLNKISISYKESLETKYWLDLFLLGKYISKEVYDIHYTDCDELSKILFTTIKKVKSK